MFLKNFLKYFDFSIINYYKIKIYVVFALSLFLILIFGLNSISIFLIITGSLLIYIFRHSKKILISNNNLFLAPCDGKIIDIQTSSLPDYIINDNISKNNDFHKISILLHIDDCKVISSIANLHCIDIIKQNGKLVFNSLTEESESNNQLIFVFQDKKKNMFVQNIISPIFKDKIITLVKKESISQGEEIAVTNFFSIIHLYIPINLKVKIQLNQRIIGKETVICENEN